MAELQKVIEGLEYCTGPMAKCGYCPYHSGDEMPNSLDDCGILKDAIELLKEHEPVMPKEERLNDVDSIYRCGNCGTHFYYRQQKYCAICGRRAKWDV